MSANAKGVHYNGMQELHKTFNQVSFQPLSQKQFSIANSDSEENRKIAISKGINISPKHIIALTVARSCQVVHNISHDLYPCHELRR